MSVNSKSVQGRRQLRFVSLHEVILDAEQLVAARDAKTLGNWPLDQLLTHLAIAINSSIDGIPEKVHWMVRLVGPFLKGWVFRRGMSPGFRLPKKLEAVAFPEGSSPEEALHKLRAAVERVRTEKMNACHPVFGQLTHEEWNLFHLRHAELHLSFVIP